MNADPQLWIKGDDLNWVIRYGYLNLSVLAGHVYLEPLAGVRHMQLGLGRGLDSHHRLGLEPGYVPQILGREVELT